MKISELLSCLDRFYVCLQPRMQQQCSCEIWLGGSNTCTRGRWELCLKYLNLSTRSEYFVYLLGHSLKSKCAHIAWSKSQTKLTILSVQLGGFCCFTLDIVESNSNLSTSARLKDFFRVLNWKYADGNTLNEAKRTSTVLKTENILYCSHQLRHVVLCGVINSQTVTHVSTFSEDGCSALTGKLNLI